MKTDQVIRLRRALLVLCGLAAMWAVVVALTGGFGFHVGDIRVSSRNPRNAIVVALLSGFAACILFARGGPANIRDELLWWTSLGNAFRNRWPWLPLSNLAAMVIALVGIGIEIHQWTDARPLWLDEEMIALNVRERSLADLAGPLWLGQSAPFGWLALQRIAVLTLGTSEQALRLIPMLFGIGTILVAVWIGGRWMRPAGAAVLVLLCSFGLWLSHYPLEVKHYSADTFWALLLPALAAWTVGSRTSRDETHRAMVWWAAASVGHWFANGAVLVVPGCALILLITLWRRHGWRPAGTFALLGLVWVASFGLHYGVALRHTLNSEYLQSYWSGGFPPLQSGLSGRLGWVARQLKPFATNPAGTNLWAMFWLSAVCGLALSPSTMFGVVIASVPLSAFTFSALRVVPLQERLSLWVVPALYIAIALLVDSAVRFGRDALARRRWIPAAFAIFTAGIALPVCFDIVNRGKEDLQRERPRASKMGLDDRTAVQWLMRLSQPGDVLITTHLALPALWWYGKGAMSASDSANGSSPRGSAILEAAYRAPGSECQSNDISGMLKGGRRALIYSGFSDGPVGFDDLLLGSLDELGIRSMQKNFGPLGRAAVVDLRAPINRQHAADRDVVPNSSTAPLDGCIVLRPARRW